MAESNTNITPSQTGAGLNLSLNTRNARPGTLTYALNAVIEGYDGQGISYQDEMGSTLVCTMPEGYEVVGKKAILERDLILFWLSNPSTGDSEMGQVKDGVYSKLINDPCLGFDSDSPIHKAFYRIVDCGLEVYWTDNTGRRYINLDKLPLKEIPNPSGCGYITTQEVDCNKLLVQPNFTIPSIHYSEVNGEGELEAGTYQFSVQYANSNGEGYTSYYSVTNPLPIQDPHKITLEFNYKVNKSIALEISGIDNTGLYDYINIAVIKTVNNISSFELVGTYQIDGAEKSLVYTGQKLKNLTEEDIFEKFPVYTKADDLYAVQDVLGWVGMTQQQRVSFQKIANQITLQWQSWQLRADAYSNPVHAAEHRGYMGDEVYPFSLVPLFKNGFQGDYFPIPGRKAFPGDLEVVSNEDIPNPGDKCDTPGEGLPRWKVYNTATVSGYHPDYEPENDCYEGPCQYGEMAYWESTDTYPCDRERWGELAGTPIRYPKMPDRSTVPHYSDGGKFIYPLGIRIDIQQVVELIRNSDLPQEVKDNIQGFKIVRGNRAHHKSVIAKGMLTNVLKYTTQDNYIDPEDTGSTAPQETFVQRLISSAKSLLARARAESGFPVSVVDGDIKETEQSLDNAYVQTPGSPEFNSSVETAETELSRVVTLLDAFFGNNSNANATIVYSYVEAALQVVQSIRDSADAFAAMEGMEIPNGEQYLFPNYLFNDVSGEDFFLDNIIADEEVKSRYCLHSPDTSFYQPNLGSVLKLEGAMYGLGSSHLVEVKEHARYQFINSIAYITSLAIGVGVGFASGMYGFSTRPFDGVAAFTAYQTLLDIIRKVTPRKNPCYQINAVGHYNQFKPFSTPGQTQRNLSLAQYLVSGMQGVGENLQLNNYLRESSVYLKTNTGLPFTHDIPGVPTDTSKLPAFDSQVQTLPISSFYGSLKNQIPNQWGQVFSYEVVDTGFQWIGDLSQNLTTHTATIFGGDTFINRFAYKSKFPFFLDHRVGAQDESDIFFNELANVGRPKYWFSTDANAGRGAFGAIFGIRPTKFFNSRTKAFYTEGKIFLFAYAIPYFFTESTVNVDMRQAFNEKEGNFYPHTGTGIPDEWLQQRTTPIEQDNTYHYNKTYSKQNKENYFSYLPQDYDLNCETYKPFLTVYSDPNRWLIYRPVSQFEFPQSGGTLTSLDVVENKAVVARFENKSLLYNAYLTINTSSPQAAYLGNDTLFKSSPPIDLSETDGGYIGSQHKLFIKTPYGAVFTDSKRGCVFLLQGNQPKNIATPEVEAFLRNHLPLQGDNHFSGQGITGVYDPQNKRILLTKLDGTQSFTLSYNFLTQSWISLHSYLPNYYVEHPTTFYAGRQDKGLWIHGTDPTLYHSFFGEAQDYVIEYPISYQYQDELLQSVKDYSQVLKYNPDGTFVYTDDWFSSCILHNDQQCSGVLKLNPRPQKSLKERAAYPKYNTDSKDILYTKSNSEYNFNTFWNTLQSGQPIWIPSQTNLSVYRDLNQAAMSYSKKSHNKAPLQAKNLKIRLINSRTDRRIISQFLTSQSLKSFK